MVSEISIFTSTRERGQKIIRYYQSLEKLTPPSIRGLIQELADYEKMPDGPKISAEQLEEDGFGAHKYFHCNVAEEEGKVCFCNILFPSCKILIYSSLALPFSSSPTPPGRASASSWRTSMCNLNRGGRVLAQRYWIAAKHNSSLPISSSHNL